MRESGTKMNMDISNDINEISDVYDAIVESRFRAPDQYATASMPTHGEISAKALHGQAKMYYFGNALLVTEYPASQGRGVVIPRPWRNPAIERDIETEFFSIPAQMLLDITPPVPISSSVSHPHLEAALEDLKDCKDEAREKDFPEPTETALHNAERLLKKMYECLPRRFEVYPIPKGGIAIQASHRPEIAVSVLCESDGGVLCLVSASDHSRRAWYSKAEVLPDGFLYDALDALKSFES